MTGWQPIETAPKDDPIGLLMPHAKTGDEAPVSYRAKHIRLLIGEINRLREALEHVTELLVDTWAHNMSSHGDPEQNLAVIDARALLPAPPSPTETT